MASLHEPSFDPHRELETLRASLNLFSEIANNPRKYDRNDVRTGIAVVALFSQSTPLSTATLAMRTGLTEAQLRRSLDRISASRILRQPPAEDYELIPPSGSGEGPITVSELQRIARAGGLRMRAFGEERPFTQGVPHFGDIEAAVEMLPRLLLNGFVALYRDEDGFLIGPANPELVNHDPFADEEEGA